MELRGSNQPQSQPQHRQVGPTHFEGAEEEPAHPRGRPATRRRRSTRCRRDGPRGAPPHRPGPADDGRRGPRPSSASTSPGGAASRACGRLRAREDPEDGQAPRPDGHPPRQPPSRRAPALHSAGGRQRPGSGLLSRAWVTPGRARRQRACCAMSARAGRDRSSTDRRPRGPSTTGQHSRTNRIGSDTLLHGPSAQSSFTLPPRRCAPSCPRASSPKATDGCICAPTTRSARQAGAASDPGTSPPAARSSPEGWRASESPGPVLPSPVTRLPSAFRRRT